MRKWYSAICCALLWLAGLPAAAQFNSRSVQGPYPSAPGYGSNYIPEGTRFVIILDDKLETSKTQPGKRFKAKLGEDLVAPNGAVIPRGKKIKGHVSSVENGLHGRILLSFDSIDTNHGSVPLAATITGVPGEHGVKTVGSEGEIQKQGTNKKRVAEGALVGAGVGAATGAVAGGTHGAIIGAGAGGVVGGVAGMLTDRNLKLDKGQQLEIQLDRPLQVP
ncbi:MAG: YMGG-like glycine zipper-containing protein [Terriglobales bacterium]